MSHVTDYYKGYDEESRLTTNNARRIEFLTSVKVLDGHLKPGLKLLDCAAGTGVYSFYYSNRGFDVCAYDLTPQHVETIRHKMKDSGVTMKTGVADARDLSEFEDESFDCVLCMGPMYHLTLESDRQKCLSECRRVLKKDGIIAVAYISRFIVFPMVSLGNRRFLNKSFANHMLVSGALTHDDPDCFWTDNYFFKPDEMEDFMEDGGFTVTDHAATDGLSPILSEKVDTLSEDEFEIWCDYHYKVCREKSILGASSHGLCIGVKRE